MANDFKEKMALGVPKLHTVTHLGAGFFGFWSGVTLDNKIGYKDCLEQVYVDISNSHQR